MYTLANSGKTYYFATLGYISRKNRNQRSQHIENQRRSNSLLRLGIILKLTLGLQDISRKTEIQRRSNSLLCPRFQDIIISEFQADIKAIFKNTNDQYQNSCILSLEFYLMSSRALKWFRFMSSRFMSSRALKWFRFQILEIIILKIFKGPFQTHWKVYRVSNLNYSIFRNCIYKFRVRKLTRLNISSCLPFL